MSPWTVAYQAPLSMEFSRQEYWSGFPSPKEQKFNNNKKKKTPKIWLWNRPLPFLPLFLCLPVHLDLSPRQVIWQAKLTSYWPWNYFIQAGKLSKMRTFSVLKPRSWESKSFTSNMILEWDSFCVKLISYLNSSL